jgi:hypothetical protein
MTVAAPSCVRRYQNMFEFRSHFPAPDHAQLRAAWCIHPAILCQGLQDSLRVVYSRCSHCTLPTPDLATPVCETNRLQCGRTPLATGFWLPKRFSNSSQNALFPESCALPAWAMYANGRSVRSRLATRAKGSAEQSPANWAAHRTAIGSNSFDPCSKSATSSLFEMLARPGSFSMGGNAGAQCLQPLATASRIKSDVDGRPAARAFLGRTVQWEISPSSFARVAIVSPIVVTPPNLWRITILQVVPVDRQPTQRELPYRTSMESP